MISYDVAVRRDCSVNQLYTSLTFFISMFVVTVVSSVVCLIVTGRSKCRERTCGAGSDNSEEQSLWS